MLRNEHDVRAAAARTSAVLVRVADYLGKRHDEWRRQSAPRPGKAIKRAARVEAARAMSTYTFAAVEARKLAGDMVPMDASQAQASASSRSRFDDPSAWLERSHRSTSPSTSWRTRSPRHGVSLLSSCSSPRREPGSPRCCSRARAHEWLASRLAQCPHRPGGRIGNVLVGDERVKLITFTGSSDVDLELRERAARRVARLRPLPSVAAIVEADADLDEAASARGQRVFVRKPRLHLRPADLHPAGHLRRLPRTLPPRRRGAAGGDPAQEDTDVGPVVDDDARERILAWIEEARSLGADVLLKWGDHDGPSSADRDCGRAAAGGCPARRCSGRS